MQVAELLTDLWIATVALFPRVMGAVLALTIGWIAGRAIGKAVSKFLDRVGADDALRKTAVGKAIERSGITCAGFFDLIVRWFIYLIAIFAAVDVLGVAILSHYMSMVVAYLPSFIAGVAIFIVGFIVADLVADFVKGVCKEAKVAYSSLFSDALRLILYATVIVLALSQMRIDVSILYIFATALAWGLAIGAGVGLGIAVGWGFKDVVAKSAKDWVKSFAASTKKVEKAIAKE